jgi:penicillin V acylase-like amidase (Ntn superfamily)
LRYCCAVILGLLAVWACPDPARPCSTFCFTLDGALVFGRNYDWKVAEGLVVVNRRHVSKVASARDNPASWTSKYGSVTFNQYGCGFPHGGMNEAGLVVEQMWLEGTRHPAADSRSSVGSLQWIQYQLDNCSSVAEVLASDQQLRIAPDSTPLHYLVCDATGQCAAIEFLDGRMVAHTGDALPFKVLTNNTYSESVAYLARFKGFGGSAEIPRTPGSLERFARAADLIRHPEALARQAPAEKAFAVLDAVAQEQFTQWRIVYEIGERRISFLTQRNPAVRTIDLAVLDFSCRQPVSLVDIHVPGSGDVLEKFKPYTTEQNRALVWAAYKKTEFTADLPDEVLEGIARYPEAAICQE